MATPAEIIRAAAQAAAQAVSQGATDRRRNRENIPTVGPHGANEVHLSPALKEILLRRATREIHQETDPTIQALQAQLPALQQALHQEVSSIKGANEVAANAVSDVSLKGIHGLARKQLADELASRQADILASTPFLASEARTDYKSQVADQQQKIAMAQAEQEEGIAKAYHGALSASRTDAQAFIKAKDKAGDRASDRRQSSKEMHQQVNAALFEAKALLEAAHGYIPMNDAEWRVFSREVGKAEGVSSPAAVREAIKRIRAILSRQQTEFAQTVGSEAAPVLEVRGSGVVDPAGEAIRRGFAGG